MASTNTPYATQPAGPLEPKIEPAENSSAQPSTDGDQTLPTEPASGNGAAESSSGLQPGTSGTSAIAAKVLQFISEATPSTLGGIAVGLSAAIYAALGRLGLLLIGAVGGVLVFISLEARNPAIAQTVRGEQGAEVLDRVLLLLKDTRAGEDGKADEGEPVFKTLDDFRPDTRDALTGLVDAVVRDYVKCWYSPIIPGDHSFPLACRKTLNSYILSISNRLSRKRPADAFLDLLTNGSSILIALLSELAAAFADGTPESNMTAADAVYNYLSSNPDSRLANLLNQKQQAAKFRMVAEELLGFLDQGSQNCDPARILLREVLANSVLETTLQTCSKAEWINGWIIYLLEAGEPDLSQAIDEGMQTGRDNAYNLFADIDGNVGNIGIAKPVAARSSLELDRSRRRESLGHRKKLSRADEELEEAMGDMKRGSGAVCSDGPGQQRSCAAVGANPSARSKQGLDAVSESRKQQSRDSPNVPQGAATTAATLPTNDASSPSCASPHGLSSSSGPENTSESTRASTLDSSPSQQSSPHEPGSRQFTTFDQAVPAGQAEGADEEGPRKAALALHNASFTIHDDSTSDSSKIRTKPNWDYLIQVEPSSSAHTGWMIVRRYSDFETLHEILRRIAAISGAIAFTELHKTLPAWKIHTRESLRGELERYLRDACWYQSLAESEGMRRFLEKSQGHSHGSSKKFGWETVGKNMLDVLTTAPKGAVEGGKTLVGGVSGVFGNIAGLTRKSTSQSVDLAHSANRLSISAPPRADMTRSPARSDRASIDSQRSSIISTQPGKMAPMSRRPSCQSQAEPEGERGRAGCGAEQAEPGSSPTSFRASREHSRASSLAAFRSPSTVSLDLTRLPPPPDDTPSDCESANGDDMQSRQDDSYQTARGTSNGGSASSLAVANGGKKYVPNKPAKQYSQISEQETRVAVELLFAVINEMYTLSSAWNIRRTLLAAAKSFLLRPGNPSLLTVQSLIQSSVLDASTSDAGIAAKIRRLRECTMPTEQERATWPAELTAEEKEKLAVKARKLLIQSGVPAALLGVMGQAATGEALGRVFDCLQIEEVARGLIFGLILQAVRIVTHS